MASYIATSSEVRDHVNVSNSPYRLNKNAELLISAQARS